MSREDEELEYMLGEPFTLYHWCMTGLVVVAVVALSFLALLFSGVIA